MSFLVWSDQTYRVPMGQPPQQEVVPICSLENISANLKVTHQYGSSKEPQKILKEDTKRFFEKKNFD